MQTVGERLRDLRENTIKITQVDMAEILGTTQQIYSNYELGKSEVPIRHLVTLADLYEVSADYLLGRTSYPQIPRLFSETYVQKVSIGDLLYKATSFNSKSRSRLVEYVNFLTFLENSKTETKAKSKAPSGNPIKPL